MHAGKEGGQPAATDLNQLLRQPEALLLLVLGRIKRAGSPEAPEAHILEDLIQDAR